MTPAIGRLWEARLLKAQRQMRVWRIMQALMRARHAARQRGEFEAADRLKHAAEASGFRLRDCGSWTWWESKERIRIPWAYCPRPFWYGWVGVRLRQAFRTGF